MQDPNKLLAKIVRRLRTIGTDTQLVEVKEAAWKLPESIGETLSAFMNHTGGILILGPVSYTHLTLPTILLV